MKRWLVFLRLAIIILLVISIILAVISSYIHKDKEKLADKKEKEEKQQIELKANQTIRVKMAQTGEIIAMDINDYLRGVVPAEMPPQYNIEALKAQAIVARTYTYNKIQGNPPNQEADVSDDPKTCQAFYNKDTLFNIWRKKGYSESTINQYWDNVVRAVNDTQNMVITYNGEYIKAYFHASSPGKTEDVSQIWSNISIPYLKSVESVENSNYQWNKSSVCVKYDDFENKIKENVNSRYSLNNRGNEDVIKINEYTTSGRVKNVKIGDDIVSAEKLRTIFGLRSTNFTLDIEPDDIKFNVIGNGHGIGMSQVGANYYASIGYSFTDIIKHYYTGVDVIKID